MSGREAPSPSTPRRGFGVPLAVLCALALGSAAFGPASPLAQAEFPQEDAWARVTPSVVWCNDPNDLVTIEVHIVHRTDVASVRVTRDNTEADTVLFDDGTNGDAIAGDKVFTRSGVRLACTERNLKYGGSVGTWLGFLNVTLQNGEELANRYGIMAGLVHRDYQGSFAVQDFGGGLSATRYAFFIHDADHAVIDDYPVAQVFCGTENFEAYRKLYSVLPDAFDFAVVTPGEPLYRPGDLAENVPYQVQVSNQVEHIGLPLMDNTELFGSSGRLKSAIYDSFGTIQIFDHEVAHTWGAGIGATLGLISEGAAGRFHWHDHSDVAGQLGSFYFADSGAIGHFADNGDGSWRLISNTETPPYAPLELYLMGLIPPGEVPPVHLLGRPDLSDPSRVTAASVRTITIDDLIAAEGGVRSPTYAESQKDFNLAYIVTQDRPYNDAAYAYFSLLSYALMSRLPPEPNDSLAPFFWATGGRATLDSRLPVDVPEPMRLPGQPVATEPAPTASSSPVVPTIQPSDGPAPSPPESISGRTPLCSLLPVGIVLGAGGLSRRRRLRPPLR